MYFPAEDRVLRIRRYLNRIQPVLGRLASFLRVGLAQDLGAEVETGTDHLLFDAAYVERADDAELRFWLAHAVLHAALLHFEPPPGAPGEWSRQCDAKVNGLLRQLGFREPPGDARERHLWWDEAAGEGGEPARQRMGAAQADEAPSSSPRRGEAQQWRLRVRQAVGEAAGSGEAEGELLRELLGHVPDRAAHDWRGQLAAFLQRWHRAEPHYGRPSRRAVEPFILPALRPAAAHLALAVDISASIEDKLLQAFWAEIQALAGQLPLRITLLAADLRLAPGAPWHFECGEAPVWPAPHGQGGTDFRPVFEWLAQSGETFDALLYFTDGKGDYPPEAPGLPVLWVLAGEGSERITPPFGEVIRL